MRTIFVSSTFADMQFERDILRDVVSPKINDMAREYNDHIEFCDLRWGINTEEMESEAASMKVLDICLDEIDRTNPPMIIILGERYGWIPNEKYVGSIAAKKKMQLDDLKKSVTALESEYGAVSLGRKALVYFRTIESDEAGLSDIYKSENSEYKALLQSLKIKLEHLPNCSVKPYKVRFENGKPGKEDLERFSEMVTEDLKTLLKPDWDKFSKMTPFQRERERQWSFIREKNAMFTARQADAENLIKEISSEQNITICKGLSGSGKSTLFSHVCIRMQKAGWNVLPFIGGLTDESNDGMDVLRNSVYYLEEQLGIKHFSDITAKSLAEKSAENVPALQMWQSRLIDLSKKYEATGKKIMIAVDAVDQLFPDEIRDNCAFVPAGVSKCIHFFMTSLPEIDFPEKHYYLLQPLMTGDIKQVISGVLARFGKELSRRVIDCILRKETSDNPYYVSMIVQRLCMMGIDDFLEAGNASSPAIIALGDKQIEILEECPDSIEEMCVKLFRDAAQLLGSDFLNNAMMYLAVSRYGLRRNDLASIIGDKWNELTFAHFMNYLREDFQIRTDGRIDFMHKTIRAGLRQLIGDDKQYDRNIAKYMDSLDPHDSLRMNEYPYHMIKADDAESFANYINKYELGNSRDQLIIDHAAGTARSICMEIGEKWLDDLIANCSEKPYWTALLWFIISELEDAFGESYLERTVRSNLLIKANEALKSIDEKGKLTERNKDIFIDKISDMITVDSEAVKNQELVIQMGNLRLDSMKKKYGNSEDINEKYKLFLAYYRNLFIHKRSVNDEILKEGIRIAEEGETLINELINKNVSTINFGPYFGCLGEIYAHLNDDDNCLRVYSKDLELRKISFERSQTPISEMVLVGGYMNVAMAHENYRNKEHYKLEYDSYVEAIRHFENSIKNGAKIQMPVSAIIIYYKAAKTMLLKANDMISVDELAQAMRWNIKSYDYARYYIRTLGAPDVFKHFEAAVNNIIDFIILPEISDECIKALYRWVKEDENELAVNEDQKSLNTFISLYTFYICAKLICNSKMTDHYDFALQCCRKGINILKSVNKFRLNSLITIKLDENNVASLMDSFQNSSNFIYSSKIDQHPKQPAPGIKKEKNLTDVIASLDIGIRPKLAGNVNEKILKNAISAYAPNVKIGDIVAIEASDGLQKGKKGVLYTKNAIYSSELGKGICIPYAKIKHVKIYGDSLCFYMLEGKENIVYFGKYQTQVYELVNKLL